MMKKLYIPTICCVLGVVCIAVAGELSVAIWHDTLLVIGGIMLGVFCGMITMINIKRRGISLD